MGLGPHATLVFAILLESSAVLWCCLWPVWPLIGQLGHFSGWIQLYTLTDSNLDLLLLVLLRALVLLLLVFMVREDSALPSRGAAAAKSRAKLRQGVAWLNNVHCCLLLAKGMVVAVGGKDHVMPEPGTGEVGLLCMFGALVASLVATWPESVFAKAALADKPKPRAKQDADGDMTLPLIVRRDLDDKEAESPSDQVNKKTVSELFRVSMPDSPILLVAFGAGAVAALGTALIPYYTGLVMDDAVLEDDTTRFEEHILKLVGVAFITCIFTGVRGSLFTLCMARLNVRLRTQLYGALLQQDVGFYDVNRTGEITSRLSADTSTVSDQVSLNLNVMLRSATQAVAVLLFMFKASWRLTIVTFILIPVVLVICKFYGAYYRKWAKKVQTELAEANSVADEVLSNITTMKSYAAQGSAEMAYTKKLAKFYKLSATQSWVYFFYAAISSVLPNLVTALVLFYGGSLVVKKEMSKGDLVAFILYQSSLSGSLQLLGDVYSSLAAAVGAADKVIELMHAKPQVAENGSLIPANFPGHIEFRDVVFKYPTRPNTRVLDGLSFTVNPGEVVALVGPSGGGKSSIVKLLEHFYKVQSGAILIDGRDVGEFDAKWLRRQIALVSQEPVLFARSIKRNIIYGLEEDDGQTAPSDEGIQQAARLANAHSFITSFPEGYETQCGEKGVQLSGGQKQRIAIARALVRTPKILLLDEATSALDADSEALVQEALDRVMQGRTVLVIAHRLSTVQDAHRILVINQGKVQEAGTHEDLYALGGMYSTLVRRQMQKTGSLANLSTLSRTDSKGQMS